MHNIPLFTCGDINLDHPLSKTSFLPLILAIRPHIIGQVVCLDNWDLTEIVTL